jgi:hypothetical protein
VKHASVYRALLQPTVPAVFDHLGSLLRSTALGRLTAMQLSDRVKRLLEVP